MKQHEPDKSSSNEPSSEKLTGRSGADYFDSSEALTAAAQKYFTSRFPNAERIGCPAPGVIQAVVQASRLPDAGLRAHVFGCSECFREYHAALLTQRQVSVNRNDGWWRNPVAALTHWRRPLLAGTFALLLFSVGMFIWRNFEKPVPQVSQSQAQPVPSAVTNTAPSVSPAPQPASPTRAGTVEHQPSELAAVRAISLDLNEYNVLAARDRSSSARAAAAPIKLPAARVRLTLRLSEGSNPGLYEVSIVNVYGKPLLATQSRSVDGQRLMATLKLRTIAVGNYYLRVGGKGEAPEVYPVIIADSPASRRSRKP